MGGTDRPSLPICFTCFQGVFSHPTVKKLWERIPKKVEKSKITIFKSVRFCQPEVLHRGSIIVDPTESICGLTFVPGLLFHWNFGNCCQKLVKLSTNKWVGLSVRYVSLESCTNIDIWKLNSLACRLHCFWKLNYGCS